LKTEVEKLEGNKVKLKVEVPSKVLDGALKKTYKDLSQRLFVPGFRKGKVPERVIDAQVGKDAVMARATEEVVASRYPEAIVRSGIEPIESPDVTVVRAEAGQDLIFEADVEVKPEAKLGEYKGLETVVPDPSVSEEELDQQIDILRGRYATLEVVQDRPVGEGDYALIDFSGKIDGEAFDAGSAEDYMVEIGSGALLKELEEGLVGMSRGESRTLQVKLPEDFHNSAIAGKEAVFDVSVKEIKRKVLPDLNDEFVSETTEHDTVEELRQDLKKKMEMVKRAQTRVQAESLVLAELAKSAEVEISDKLIELEVDNMVRELAENLQRQGSNLEEYLEMTKSGMADVREQFREDAVKRIRRELAIIAVAKAENMDVSREELDAEIVEIAAALKRPVPEVRLQIDQKGTLPDLRASLIRRKTVDWLLENADVMTEEGKKVDLTPPQPPVVEAGQEQAEAIAEDSAGTEAVSESPADVEEETRSAAEVRPVSEPEGEAPVEEGNDHE